MNERVIKALPEKRKLREFVVRRSTHPERMASRSFLNGREMLKRRHFGISRGKKNVWQLK